MGLTHVTVCLKPVSNNGKNYQADFLVNTGATDSIVPGCELRQIGVKELGKMAYELAEWEFG